MLKPHIVLYRDNTLLPLDVPYAFSCMAEDSDHAEEQCIDAAGDYWVDDNGEILWVVDTDNPHVAYDDYWGNTDTP